MPDTTAQEAWLVALSAPLSAFNGDRVNAVATGKANDQLREGVAQMWDVNDRASFEDRAAWLAQEGHRTLYAPLWQAIAAVDDAVHTTHPVVRGLADTLFPAFFQIKARKSLDYKALAAQSGHSLSDVAQMVANSRSWLDELRKHFKVQPSQIANLVAWDAVRLVSLTRWAVQLGFIDRTEFARFAGALKPQVQQAYTDWAQVSAAYIAGGLIWRYSLEREGHLLRTNRLLLSDARSPYRGTAFR
ncbi:DUF1266 domain-containing protein [Variovorax sp. H27-G14]|uniref:DUF1266 domain-containing protein n=1 Tax=Variovorax sp. H27-G14 TaxID=3111914 RepID=UPI0038FC9465